MAKKLLSMALAVLMAASLICLPASAEVSIPASVTFEGGIRPEGTTSSANNIVAGIYGKDITDYCAQIAIPNDASIPDKYFTATNAVEIPTGGKVKLSFDIAANTFDCSGSTPLRNLYGRQVLVRLNNQTNKYMFQANNVSFDNNTKANTYLKANAWNNVTAVFEFNETNTSANYTMYVNGNEVLNVPNLSLLGTTALTSISFYRVGGHVISTDRLYYDNFLIETYTANETNDPSTEFDLKLSEDCYSNVVVDKTAKTVTVDNPDMSVSDFKADSPDFTFVGENGASVADSANVSDAGITLYAKYTNGINMYYVPYTVVVNRDYAIKHETFETSNFNTISNGSSGTIYNSVEGLAWKAQSKTEGVTIGEGKGLGGKVTDDKSLLIDVAAAKANSDPYINISEPYVSSGKILKTHTFEAMLYKEGVDTGELQDYAIDLMIGGRVVLRFFADGSVKTKDGSQVTSVRWENGSWLPVAATYDKETSTFTVYAGGVNVNCGKDWTPAPSNTEIRLRTFIKSGATFKLAIDDVKFYAGKLEMIKYDIDRENATVTADATENLPCIPFIAEYDNDEKLIGVTFENGKRTITRNYEEGNAVKIFLFESLKKLIPITEAYPVE